VGHACVRLAITQGWRQGRQGTRWCRAISQRIVDWPAHEPNSLLFSDDGILIENRAAKRIVLRIGHFTGKDVVIRAVDDAGGLQMALTKTSANSVETLEMTGADISSVRISRCKT